MNFLRVLIISALLLNASYLIYSQQDPDGVDQALAELQQFPPYQTVLDSFFTQYVYDYTEDMRLIKFGRQPSGWITYEQEINNGDSMFNWQLFWSLEEQKFLPLNYATQEETNINVDDLVEKNYLDRYAHIMFGPIPYYGYPNWEYDVIEVFGEAAFLPDSLWDGLARAYSGVSEIQIDRKGNKSSGASIDQSDIQAYMKYHQLEMQTWGKILERYPSYENFIGNIYLKYSNEEIDAYLKLNSIGEDELAAQYMDLDLYHDVTLSIAKNYLNSCQPNAILFTNGDSDTYPLWYVQEKLGFRKDVAVINIPLLSVDWYIDWVRERYNLEMIFSPEDYEGNKRDIIRYWEANKSIDTFFNLNKILAFIASDDRAKKITMVGGELENYLPAKCLYLDVNNEYIKSTKILTKVERQRMLESMQWCVTKKYLLKNDIILYDIIASNIWKRPIYIAVSVRPDSYIGMDNFFRLEGLAYRIVPVKNDETRDPNVALDIMYKNMMDRFVWEGMNDIKVMKSNGYRRMCMNIRANFSKLAEALLDSGDKRKAEKVLDYCLEVIPEDAMPLDIFSVRFPEIYYQLGEEEKARQTMSKIAATYTEKYKQKDEVDRAWAVLKELERVAKVYEDQEGIKLMNQVFENIN